MEVIAAAGSPLRVTARAANGRLVAVESMAPLERARSQPADEGLLRDQLGRLGSTIYRLGRLEAAIHGSPMIPKSLLNQLRRDLVSRLDDAAGVVPPRAIAAGPVLPELLAPILAERARQHTALGAGVTPPELSVLCRRTSQIETAVAEGILTIYADYQDIKEYSQAIIAARRGGARVYLATPRIEKPAEANLFHYLAKLGADGILVRNAGGLYFCAQRSIPFVADFSLNAANPLAVELFKNRGALRVTASYDLNAGQLFDLLDAVPADWLEVVIHQQIPMFHMEHCVYCAFLSPGTDRTNCGRPCDHHDVKLRDRVGVEHPLKADVGCRNTLFNAVPQTAAEYLPRLLARGAKNLRVEFLDDEPAAVRRVIGLYQAALTGHRQPGTLWRELKASSQYGVTRGPLKVL
jgi:putative protease